jgi:hypothetical protein
LAMATHWRTEAVGIFSSVSLVFETRNQVSQELHCCVAVFAADGIDDDLESWTVGNPLTLFALLHISLPSYPTVLPHPSHAYPSHLS